MKLLILLTLVLSNIYANDIYFEMYFDKAEGLFKRMLEVDVKDPHCKVYIYQNKHKVVVSPGDESEVIEKFLSKICEDKLKLVKKIEVENFLENYDFTESKSGWKIYHDKTGISEVNEIWLKESKKEIELIEKRSIGTSRYEYKLKGDLITKVSTKVYEGLQSITSEHEIEYKNIAKKQYPIQVKSKFIQKLSKRDIGEFERNFDEVILIKNYKVDQNVALKYFSQSN